MKPEIKTQWVAALRSGEYKQGIGYLNTSEGFCCLGVLSDLYSKETGVQWLLREMATKGEVMSIEESCAVLPSVVATWAGIEGTPYETEMPKLPFTDRNEQAGSVSLAVLNDCGDFNFSQIADIIEHTFV